MARPPIETRQNFETGKVDAWTAGDYGHQVRVLVHRGKVKIKFRHPRTEKRIQQTVFDQDTPKARKAGAALAVTMSERIRSGELTHPKIQERAEDLTLRTVMMLYLRRYPGFPDHLLAGTATQLIAWHDQLTDGARSLVTVPKSATLVSDVYAFRRLLRDERFRGDRKVLDVEVADATGYFADWVASGKSKRTGTNDLDRLSCAINYVIRQHRKTIRLTENPIEGRVLDRGKADIADYSRQEMQDMWAAAPALAAEGQWQVLVAAGIASSGRRVGSIMALTLSDHDFEAGTVTWRAEEAKGEAYGRGDDIRPMTGLHRSAVSWAMEHVPNPMGPDFPILYRTGGKNFPENPAESVPYSTLWGQLTRLEVLAGVEHKEGRLWHSFRRSVATLLADAIGDGKASEYIGMTTETLRRYGYKKVQPAAMDEAREALDMGFSMTEEEVDE